MNGATSAGRSATARGALVVLTVTSILNFLDRQVINILAEAIKLDLLIADWQLGMLTGLAFALLYTTLGVPIARYAEYADRPRIIAASVMMWSACTVACGFALNFAQLVAARVGVGVGEAGCTPASHALISDLYPREKRASALSLFSMGAPIGSLFGLAIGGLIAGVWGWRVAFIAAGVPGLIVAFIVLATIKDPRRRALAKPDQPGLGAVLKVLLGKRALVLIAAAASLQAFASYGQQAFTGSFFFRSHGVEIDQYAASLGLQPIAFLGLALGLSGGVAGILGAVVGGKVADRWIARDSSGYVLFPALLAGAAAPFFLGAMFAGPAWLGIALLVAPMALNTAWFGPIYAAIQSLVAPHMRATAVAVVLLVINLVGLGLGPMAIGALSDLLGSSLGSAGGLRWALAASSAATVASVLLLLAARRHIQTELVD